jgi:arylsulfatase A-like enzyme
MDKHIGEILQTLRELGVEDEVCIIISADHGESMGEQGIYMEHASATEAVHHLPLIMKIPGVTKSGTVIDGFVYNVDVVATIVELLGLDVPVGWDGKSFLPALRGEEWKGRNYLIMDHGLFTCQRAVRDERWYFIRTYHSGLYRFDKVTLYDMVNDPHQTKNVADRYPEVVKEMDHRLSQWLQENLGKPGHIVDPLQKVVETGPWKYVTLESWVQRLRKEGWNEAAEALLRKYTNEVLQSVYGS